MRIYLGATLSELAHLRDDGIVPAGFTAHAVTPALREWYAEGDLDELEHAAFLQAARASLQRLAEDPEAVRLRVVLSADVADSAVRVVAGGDEERGLVVVDADLHLGGLASVHVDEAQAVADVTAAVEAWTAAMAGDEDAQFVVDGAEGHDLLWYDVTELDAVLALDTR